MCPWHPALLKLSPLLPVAEQVHRPQVVVHTHPYQAVEDQGMGLGAGCRQLSLQPGQLLPCVGVQGSPAQGCFVSHRCHKCRVQA